MKSWRNPVVANPEGVTQSHSLQPIRKDCFGYRLAMTDAFSFFTLISFCYLLPSFVYAKNCQEVQTALLASQSQLKKLEEKHETLEKKFKEYVKADFEAQTEGIMGQFHRNKAKKVHLAKKSLLRKIRKKEARITKYRGSFCKDCLPPLKKSLTKYCRICTQVPGCKVVKDT